MMTGRRSVAGLMHLAISLLVISFVAFIVFFLWYPYPFYINTAGTELFLLVFFIDLIIGPFLTFIVFNKNKQRRELIRDLAFVAAIQVAALAYGLHTAYKARPMLLVHEVDRFQVVTLAEIDDADLGNIAPQFRVAPWDGVRLIGVRGAKNVEERINSIASAISGKDVALMPERWQELSEENKAEIRRRSVGVNVLRARSTDGGMGLEKLLIAVGGAEAELIALPLISRRDDWVIVLKRTDFSVLGYLPINLFD